MPTIHKQDIPLLPLRGVIVYPTMLLHIDVGRERSIFAIEHALAGERQVFLATQKDLAIENPEKEDLHTLGTLATIKSMTQLPNGTYRVLIEGIHRAKWCGYKEADLYPVVNVAAARGGAQFSVQGLGRSAGVVGGARRCSAR